MSSMESGGRGDFGKDFKFPSEENNKEANALEDGARPFDVKTIGPVQVDHRLGDPTIPKDKFTITADHEFVKLPPEIALKYDKNVSELPVGGKVFKGDKLVEEYKVEYAQMPNGSIRTARMESNFADGSKEELMRSFDKQGRAKSEQDVLDGKLRSEIKYTYGSDGRKTEVVRVNYDEDGNETYRAQSKMENGEVVTRVKQAGEEDHLVDLGKQKEADLYHLGYLGGQKTVEGISGGGRLLNK